MISLPRLDMEAFWQKDSHIAAKISGGQDLEPSSKTAAFHRIESETFDNLPAIY